MGNIVAWSFRQRHLCACTLYVTSIYHVPYTLKELSVSVAAQISTCVVHYITVSAFRGGSVLAEVSGWTGMKRSEFEAFQVFKWFTKRSSSPPSPAVARIIFSAASRNCKCIFWQPAVHLPHLHFSAARLPKWNEYCRCYSFIKGQSKEDARHCRAPG